jgi:hypothetical protein
MISRTDADNTRSQIQLRKGVEFAGWVTSLFTALARMMPGNVIASVLSFLFSQILFVISLILPWKILIALSTGHLSSIFPRYLARYTLNEVVTSLILCTFVALSVQILLDFTFEVLARRGASTIMNRHRKTRLFNNQHRIAVGFYRHMLRVFAGIGTCGLVMLALALIYPLVLFALLACFTIGLMGVAAWQRTPPDTERLPSAVAFGKFWLGGGFVFLTSWIVGDFLSGSSPPLTTTFVCLLLARQALACAALVVQSLRSLAEQRARVDALFMADVPWIPTPRAMDDFQMLLAPQHHERWVRDILLRSGEQDSLAPDVQLRMAEKGKLAYLVATTDGDASAFFLLKLFHHSLDALVEHEREIASVAESGWPAPLLVGHHRVEHHHCLVFRCTGDGGWLDRPRRNAQLPALRTRLLDCLLPDELVDRYDRSHPSLVRRLSDIDWSGLKGLATSAEMADCCASVERRWNLLLDEVGALPRHLLLPGLAGRMMASGPAGQLPVICNWSRWRWEPVGAGWPTTPEGHGALQSALDHYQGPRDDLADVDGETAYRAALLHEMEHQLSTANPSGAFIAVKRLSESIARTAATPIAFPTIFRKNALAARNGEHPLPC